MESIPKEDKTMTKKHFIALADTIKRFNKDDRFVFSNIISGEKPFSAAQLTALGNFCKEQNPNFNRERWLAYIAGECEANGGKR
jgi:hypothetical protein